MTNIRPPGQEMLPRGSATSRTQTYRRETATYTGRIPTSTRSIAGGVTQRLPTGRPVASSATASAFGGANGGAGVAAQPITGAGPISIGGIGSSFTHAGVGIMNTFGSIVPLAIQVIVIVIVLKIVFWLVKRRR